MKLKMFALAIAALLPTAAWAEGEPPVGVYACHSSRGAVPQAMFGILDDSTYNVFNGSTGQYAYNAGSGVISMTDGPLAGTRYKRVPANELTFQLLDGQGNLSAYTCPLSGQDPNQHPW